MSASDWTQRLHDAGLPHTEVKINDYMELQYTKIRLDAVRKGVDKRYEDLSKCRLDEMTHAKAQLDHMRQMEKDCFEEFERAHDRAVAIVARLVGVDHSTVARDNKEVEDDTDKSALGPLPRVTPRRIRAPTRASAGPSRRVTRHTQARATSTGVSSDPIIRALATHAGSDASVKALMKIVATGSANQRQMQAFQKVIDEVTVTLNGNIAQAASLEYIKQESTSDS
jgi:gamma-glutamyl:cysteine ligase YbdK (ATP-grasp superfamily)